LLHIGKDEPSFIFAGYQLGPGNVDELQQGLPLVTDFVEAVGKGVMKLLIADRGLISGAFVTHVKSELGSDVLMPLRSNMDALTDPVRIAEAFGYKWTKYDEYSKYGVKYLEEVTVVGEVKIWKGCEVALYVSLMRITGSDGSVRHWGLSSTFEPKTAREAFDLYALRTQIEERHRQIKNFWRINKFTSPDGALVEAHVLFTLLTYSLVQLYLNKNHLTAIANKTIQSLRSEEQMGINSVIVYSGAYFAVFDLQDYTEIIIDLNEEARSRLQKWIKVFRQRDKFKGS